MAFSLFRVSWTLLHMIISALHFLECVWISVRRQLDLLHKKRMEDELNIISRHVKLFDKAPSHLVVIVGNESISYRDLANIAVWCIAAGISFISYYDHHGMKHSWPLHGQCSFRNICIFSIVLTKANLRLTFTSKIIFLVILFSEVLIISILYSRKFEEEWNRII